MPRSALVLCTTYHQLVMGQAIHCLVRSDYDSFRLVWHGDRPLLHLGPLLTPAVQGEVMDCAGFRRIKPWRKESDAVLARATALLEEILAGFPEGTLDLFTGNDNQGFFQVARRVARLPWDRVVLFEEGIGFYLGSRKFLEKTAINLTLLARPQYRLRYRDFSRNRSIRRFACNHPALLDRRGVQILDTGPAYGTVLRELSGRPGAPAGRPRALYVSGNFSEAGHLSAAAECAMVEHLVGAIRLHAGTERVHVKFHPLDSPAKRARLLGLGLVDIGKDEPLEIECLRRPPDRLYSFRSSVLLNLALLRDVQSRLWIVRGRGPGYDRLNAPGTAPLFDHLVGTDPRFGYFDPGPVVEQRHAV